MDFYIYSIIKIDYKAYKKQAINFFLINTTYNNDKKTKITNNS